MDIKNADLNLMTVFESVWAERNVSKAAHRMGLSQPAMSAALSRLRDLYQDPLFVRSPRGMVPTHTALQIEKPIRDALALLRTSFRKEEAFDSRMCERIFHVALTDWFALELVPRLLMDLKKKAPGVSLVFHNLTPKQMHDMVMSGEIDLAVTGQENYGSGKYQQTLYREEYRTIVSTKHPRIKKRLSLEEFVKFSHVLFSPQGHGLGDVDRALTKKNLKRKIALRIPYSLTIPLLIQDTDFIATVPMPLASYFERLKVVRVFVPPLILPSHNMVQYWNQKNHTDPAHRWFRALVSEVCREFQK